MEKLEKIIPEGKMGDKKWLTVGDKVVVFFERIHAIRGEIIAMSTEGDTLEYSIKDEEGKIHQVNNYYLMSEL